MTKITAQNLFNEAIKNDTQKRKKLWKNLAEGKDKMIHYVIALNKWFFHDKHRVITVKECAELCNRTIGSTRNALNSMTERYNLLNKNEVDGLSVYTPRKDKHSRIPLQKIFDDHIAFRNG